MRYLKVLFFTALWAASVGVQGQNTLRLEEYGEFDPSNIDIRTSPFLSPLSRSEPVVAPSVMTQAQQRSVKDTLAEFLVPNAYWEGEKQRVFISTQFYEVGDILKLEIRENPELYQKSVIEVVVQSMDAEQVGFQETIGSEVYPVTYNLDPDLDSRRLDIGRAVITHVGTDENLLQDPERAEELPLYEGLEDGAELGDFLEDM